MNNKVTLIEVSGQYGDSGADSLFWPMQRRLNECFDEAISGFYMKTVEVLSIIFRVSGDLVDFGSAAPERLKYIKKENLLTIDLVFPRRDWRVADRRMVVKEVVEGIRACMKELKERAMELGELEDASALDKHFNSAMSKFCNENL